MRLLSSDSQEVQRYATGAMRNIIYENMDNKAALIEAGGIPQLVNALAVPDDELRKNITGIYISLLRPAYRQENGVRCPEYSWLKGLAQGLNAESVHWPWGLNQQPFDNGHSVLSCSHTPHQKTTLCGTRSQSLWVALSIRSLGLYQWCCI